MKARANVNARRMKDGWTPLFLAGIFGLSYKVQYLLDSGADVLLCDERGLTVMDWVGRYRVLAVQASLKSVKSGLDLVQLSSFMLQAGA